jgi:hypothetical protein
MAAHAAVLPAQRYWAPSSPGDLADRWTILKLKERKAGEAGDEATCAAAVRRLRELALPAFDTTASALVEALSRINEALWALEDRVRALIKCADPESQAAFVRAARGIPLLNDTRNHLKARIDTVMGYGDLQDPKCYYM